MPIPPARLPSHDEVLRTRVAVNDHRPGHAVVDLPDGSGARRVDGLSGTSAGIRIGGVSKFAAAPGESSTVVAEGDTPLVVSTLSGAASLQVDDRLKVETGGTFGLVSEATVGGFVVALARETLSAQALADALAAGAPGVVIVARLVPRGELVNGGG